MKLWDFFARGTVSLDWLAAKGVYVKVKWSDGVDPKNPTHYVGDGQMEEAG